MILSTNKNGARGRGGSEERDLGQKVTVRSSVVVLPDIGTGIAA
jgi:hypothetical protein